MAEKIVVLDRPLQLAKEWVKNMTGGGDGVSDDEEIVKDVVGRPSRLGLGAKYVPHSQVAALMNPVQKKMKEKLERARQAKNQLQCVDEVGESAAADEDDEDDDGGGGRSSAFKGKREHVSSDELLSYKPVTKKMKKRSNTVEKEQY